MPKKKMQDNELLLKKLTEETQDIITNKFLLYYTGKGKLDYRSAIVRMLNNEIKKKDARKITYQDYLFLKCQMWADESKKPAQFTYRESFIKFLFAFDYLHNPMGFEKIFIKNKLVKNFKRRLDGNTIRKSKYAPRLTLQQINSIETILKVIDNNDITRIKEAFSWYMLFYTDCPIHSLRNEIKAENYIDGKVVLENEENYIIPDKFIPLFNYLKSRTYTGYNLDLTINNLGKKIGLKKLKPGDIRQSRNENIFLCQACGKKYLNLYDNWKSVNGRIVCRYCAENFKKNYKFSVAELDSEDIFDDVTKDIEKSAIFYSYNQLKNKLNEQVNYLELHKYLIEIGKLGEAFVFDYEQNKLVDTAYECRVDNTPSLDSKNGYDIKSFERNGNDLFIEVKTTTGFDDDFYISKNELETARKLIAKGKKYYIYRVYNILAKDKKDVIIKIIKDITNSKQYLIKPINYIVETVNLSE